MNFGKNLCPLLSEYVLWYCGYSLADCKLHVCVTCFNIGTCTSTTYPFSTWSSFEPVGLIPFRTGVTNFTCCILSSALRAARLKCLFGPCDVIISAPDMFHFEPLTATKKSFDPCLQRANPNHRKRVPLGVPTLRSLEPWQKRCAATDDHHLGHRSAKGQP